MSTAPMAAALFQLQQFDLELERILAEQQTIAHALQGTSTIQQLHSEQDRAQQQLRFCLQAQQEDESVLENISKRLHAQEQRLFGGSVSNPKELSALQQEVQRLRAQQGQQEEIVLEAMDRAESLQETVQRATVALQQAEVAWAKESASLLLHRDQVAAKQQEMQAKRTQAAEKIASALLSRYETVRRLKQGRAVSKVEQDACQACRVTLTPNDLQRMRTNSANELQICGNCGRILYYDR